MLHPLLQRISVDNYKRVLQAHKAGRKAGQSARQKHAEKKGAQPLRGRRLCACAFLRLLPVGRICSAGFHTDITVLSTGGRTGAVHSTGRLPQSRAERMNAAKLQRCSLCPYTWQDGLRLTPTETHANNQLTADLTACAELHAGTASGWRC